MKIIIEMQALLIAGAMAAIAVVWLVAAIAVYKMLRRLIVGSPGSPARRVLFALVCGTIVAPGVVGFGHPPPIPSPGAALLGLAYLSEMLRGHRSEDSFFLAYANLASWALVTACIGLGELWRLRSRAYLVRGVAMRFARDVASGLRTGKPRWVIPGACIAAAIAAFFVLNGPVGEPARISARVIACGPHVHWLTRIKKPYCGAQLGDGSIYSFEEPDPSVYGRTITILHYQRRFAGTHDMVQKD